MEKIDVWGRRRLTYEIKKRTEGIYAVIDMQATPEAVADNPASHTGQYLQPVLSRH